MIDDPRFIVGNATERSFDCFRRAELYARQICLRKQRSVPIFVDDQKKLRSRTLVAIVCLDYRNKLWTDLTMEGCDYA